MDASRGWTHRRAANRKNRAAAGGRRQQRPEPPAWSRSTQRCGGSTRHGETSNSMHCIRSAGPRARRSGHDTSSHPSPRSRGAAAARCKHPTSLPRCGRENSRPWLEPDRYSSQLQNQSARRFWNSCQMALMLACTLSVRSAPATIAFAELAGARRALCARSGMRPACRSAGGFALRPRTGCFWTATPR